jgi:hypothetical protein
MASISPSRASSVLKCVNLIYFQDFCSALSDVRHFLNAQSLAAMASESSHQFSLKDHPATLNLRSWTRRSYHLSLCLRMLSSDGLPPGQSYSVIVPLRHPSFNSTATLEVNPADSLLRNFYTSTISDPWHQSSSLSEFLVSFAFELAYHAIVLHRP